MGSQQSAEQRRNPLPLAHHSTDLTQSSPDPGQLSKCSGNDRSAPSLPIRLSPSLKRRHYHLRPLSDLPVPPPEKGHKATMNDKLTSLGDSARSTALGDVPIRHEVPPVQAVPPVADRHSPSNQPKSILPLPPHHPRPSYPSSDKITLSKTKPATSTKTKSPKFKAYIPNQIPKTNPSHSNIGSRLNREPGANNRGETNPSVNIKTASKNGVISSKGDSAPNVDSSFMSEEEARLSSSSCYIALTAAEKAASIYIHIPKAPRLKVGERFVREFEDYFHVSGIKLDSTGYYLFFQGEDAVQEAETFYKRHGHCTKCNGFSLEMTKHTNRAAPAIISVAHVKVPEAENRNGAIASHHPKLSTSSQIQTSMKGEPHLGDKKHSTGQNGAEKSPMRALAKTIDNLPLGLSSPSANTKVLKCCATSCGDPTHNRAYNPLLSCTRCKRHYHQFCGYPLPEKGNETSGVCQYCIKSLKKVHDDIHLPTPPSSDNTSNRSQKGVPPIQAWTMRPSIVNKSSSRNSSGFRLTPLASMMNVIEIESDSSEHSKTDIPRSGRNEVHKVASTSSVEHKSGPNHPNLDNSMNPKTGRSRLAYPIDAQKVTTTLDLQVEQKESNPKPKVVGQPLDSPSVRTVDLVKTSWANANPATTISKHSPTDMSNSKSLPKVEASVGLCPQCHKRLMKQSGKKPICTNCKEQAKTDNELETITVASPASSLRGSDGKSNDISHSSPAVVHDNITISKEKCAVTFGVGNKSTTAPPHSTIHINCKEASKVPESARKLFAMPESPGLKTQSATRSSPRTSKLSAQPDMTSSHSTTSLRYPTTAQATLDRPSQVSSPMSSLNGYARTAGLKTTPSKKRKLSVSMLNDDTEHSVSSISLARDMDNSSLIVKIRYPKGYDIEETELNSNARSQKRNKSSAHGALPNYSNLDGEFPEPHFNHSPSRPKSRPDYSYAKLIGMALLASRSGRMEALQICNWVVDTIPGYSLAEKTFVGGISAVLSQKKDHFMKIPRPANDPGKRCYWGFTPGTGSKYSPFVPYEPRVIPQNHPPVASDDAHDNDYSSDRSLIVVKEPNAPNPVASREEQSEVTKIEGSEPDAVAAETGGSSRCYEPEQILDSFTQVDEEESLPVMQATVKDTSILPAEDIKPPSQDSPTLAETHRLMEQIKSSFNHMLSPSPPTPANEDVEMGDTEPLHSKESTRSLPESEAEDGEGTPEEDNTDLVSSLDVTVVNGRTSLPDSTVSATTLAGHTPDAKSPTIVETQIHVNQEIRSLRHATQLRHEEKARFFEILGKELDNTEITERELFTACPDLHPDRVLWDSAAKVREIRNRPTRKADFRCLLASARRNRMDPHVEVDRSVPPLEPASSKGAVDLKPRPTRTASSNQKRGNFLHDGLNTDDAQLTEFPSNKVVFYDSLEALLGLPENPVPLVYENVLAFREGIPPGFGRQLPRAKNVYKVGRNVVGQLK